MIKELAARATVPVALNLDHGGRLEDIARCLNLGFSSVMIDASSFDFEENIPPHGHCERDGTRPERLCRGRTWPRGSGERGATMRMRISIPIRNKRENVLSAQGLMRWP